MTKRVRTHGLDEVCLFISLDRFQRPRTTVFTAAECTNSVSTISDEEESNSGSSPVTGDDRRTRYVFVARHPKEGLRIATARDPQLYLIYLNRTGKSPPPSAETSPSMNADTDMARLTLVRDRHETEKIYIHVHFQSSPMVWELVMMLGPLASRSDCRMVATSWRAFAINVEKLQRAATDIANAFDCKFYTSLT